MKIITTTIEDFIKAEIDEWGFDYVEGKFASGYEPHLVNGVWCWYAISSAKIGVFGSNTISGILANSGPQPFTLVS